MANKRLFTEEDVRRLAPGSELVLGAGAIATPAALDLAFQRGVRVRWADGGISAAVAAGSSLWQRILAADGDYLVQVRNGRATVFRLEEAGPVPLGHEDSSDKRGR